MSIPYEQVGRTRQKHRTRNALIAAARELVAAGSTPTVEEAAVAAGISRSTAFRYFPNQRSLLVAAHPEIEASSLLPPDAPDDDAAARFEAVIEAFTQLVADTEPQQRTMLRMSLEPDAVEHDRPCAKDVPSAGLRRRCVRSMASFHRRSSTDSSSPCAAPPASRRGSG